MRVCSCQAPLSRFILIEFIPDPTANCAHRLRPKSFQESGFGAARHASISLRRHNLCDRSAVRRNKLEILVAPAANTLLPSTMRCPRGWVLMEWYKGKTSQPIRRQISPEICRLHTLHIAARIQFRTGLPTGCSRFAGPPSRYRRAASSFMRRLPPQLRAAIAAASERHPLS
jgi:hypothetical protein